MPDEPIWSGSAASVKSTPWLGLNSNSLAGFGALNFWPSLGVVWDRIECQAPAAIPAARIQTAISNGMSVVLIIEDAAYSLGQPFPTGGAIATYAAYVVSTIRSVLQTFPGGNFLFEISNEPWTTGFYTPVATAAQYADAVVQVLAACQAAGIDLATVYSMAQHAAWVTAMLAQQPTLVNLIKGWSIHPYGSPPPGSAASTLQGIAAVPQWRDQLTCGANNILISEIGVQDFTIGGVGQFSENVAMDSARAQDWTNRILQAGAKYAAAGWLKAMLLYNRNTGGFATNSAGGALTSIGTALAQFPQPLEEFVTATYSATDDGMLTVTMDPDGCNGAVTLAAGKLHLFRARIDRRKFAQRFPLWVDTAGAGLTAAQNFAAIYDANGNLWDQSADQSAAWVSAGYKEAAIAGGDNYKPGVYYLGLLSNGTTPPKFRGNPSALGVNFGNGHAAPFRAMQSTASFTAPPATVNLATGFVEFPNVALIGLS